MEAQGQESGLLQGAEQQKLVNHFSTTAQLYNLPGLLLLSYDFFQEPDFKQSLMDQA